MVLIDARRTDDDQGLRALRLRGRERVGDDRLLGSLHDELDHPASALSQGFGDVNDRARRPARPRHDVINARMV